MIAMSTRLMPRTTNASTRRLVTQDTSCALLTPRKAVWRRPKKKTTHKLALRDWTTVLASSEPSRHYTQHKAIPEKAEIVDPIELKPEDSTLSQYLTSWEALPSRVKLLLSAFISFVVCNMDKVNMSVAIIPMAQQYGWNATVSGMVQSAFFYGYMLCQLPGGYLTTRFTGSRMLPIGVGIWSTATFGLPLVGGSIVGLCFSRSLVGLGEAMAPGAVADVIASMIPPEERSRAVSFVNSGLYAGTILGLLTSPVLISSFGWESVFYVFGGIGILWVAFWEILVSKVKSADQETYLKIRGNRTANGTRKGQTGIPWRGMLRCRPIQALMYTHFCSGWFHFSILSWLPSYFSSTLGLALGDAARISLIPPIAGVYMNLLGKMVGENGRLGVVISSVAGPTADALISRGWRVGLVRKLSQCIAFVGPSLCLLGASTTNMTEMKIAFLTGAIGLGSFCLTGLYSNPQDLSPKYAGFIHSMTTTAGAIPGIIAVPVTGAILDATDSWPLALFVPSVMIMLSGACVFAIFGRGHEVSFPDNKPFTVERHINFKSFLNRTRD